MDQIVADLSQDVRELITGEGSEYSDLSPLLNNITDDPTIFEPIVTFFENSPSQLHRHFARELRESFSSVLRAKLSTAAEELEKERFSLYSALLDMYNLEGCPERLHGLLTLNYDNFLECAAAHISERQLDLGVAIPPEGAANGEAPLRLIKLHGSFNWHDAWPISLADDARGLWIPPGINKNKQDYPFTVLWGAARDLLNCDVLRVVGCQLSANDWDLISLLFTTRHANRLRGPYTVEVIDNPRTALSLREKYPFLEIRSLVDIETLSLGDHFTAALLNQHTPVPFRGLSSADKDQVLAEAERRDKNWFRVWLILMAEALVREPEVRSLETETNSFSTYLGV